jgi:hypothetical protein
MKGDTHEGVPHVAWHSAPTLVLDKHILSEHPSIDPAPPPKSAAANQQQLFQATSTPHLCLFCVPRPTQHHSQVQFSGSSRHVQPCSGWRVCVYACACACMCAQPTCCKCPRSGGTANRAMVLPKKEFTPVAVTMASSSPDTTTAPAKICGQGRGQKQGQD